MFQIIEVYATGGRIGAAYLPADRLSVCPRVGPEKSMAGSPTKTCGVVLGKGPITRQARIGSNRARIRSSDKAAGLAGDADRAAVLSSSATRSRITSSADSPARRTREFGSPIASR